MKRRFRFMNGGFQLMNGHNWRDVVPLARINGKGGSHNAGPLSYIGESISPTPPLSLFAIIAMKRLLIFILLGFLYQPGFCQLAGGWHPYFVSIGKTQGLPSEEVYDMMEDDRGFMWLATGAGLTRYDGHTFKTWQSEAQTSASGSCIQQDDLGRIWYENFDGYLYYTSGNDLLPLRQRTPGAYMPYSVTAHHLFVPTHDGVDVYDIKTLKFVRRIAIPYARFEHSAGYPSGIVLVVDGTLYRVDTNFKVYSRPLQGAKHEVHQVFCKGDSTFIIKRSTGATNIEIFNNRLNEPVTVPAFCDGQLQSVCRIEQKLWICSSNGCRVSENEQSRSLFPGKSISAVTRDSRGNYWFSTTNEGVFIVPDMATEINILNGHKVKQVVATQKGILVGSQNGDLLMLPNGHDGVKLLHHDAQNADIYYLYADSDNIIYSASGFTMLSRSNTARSGLLAVKSVYPVGNDHYAVAASGTCGLLARHIHSNKSANNTGGQPLTFDTILLATVRGRSTVYDTTTGTLVFATNRGILCISAGKTYSVVSKSNPIFAASLALHDGFVYAADTKGTLFRFAPGDSTAVIPSMQGNGRVKLLRQSNGRIYYTAGSRIYELRKGNTSHALRCYINAEAINDLAANDTTLWLATNNGLIACNLTSTNTNANSKRPPFYINGVSVNGRETTDKELADLSPGDNNISIYYSLVEFAQTEPSMVSYRLNDGAWTELSNEDRTLQFRSLGPGQYNIRFRVNGTEVAEGVSFTIRTPFWRQLWFYMLCALAALAIGQVIYHRRVKTKMRKMEEQRQKSQLEEQLSRSMLTALRSQMNPHFFFNALNTIQAYIFTNEKTKAGNYLSKFSMLTRTVLEMSETESVVLHDEIAAMKLYLELEKMRFGDDFEYTIDLDGINDTGAIEIPSMILQPFVENAVKHGLMHKEGPKRLVIRCERAGSVVRITVDDNGIGRSRSQALNEIKKHKYKSYSTRATAERVRLLNEQQPGKIRVEITDKIKENGIAGGTTVTITIII